MTQRAVPPEPSFIPRPRLAFRVGITGARVLDAAALTAMREKLPEVLGNVRMVFHKLASEPGVAELYVSAPPLLRLISPLAEGADRLAAEAALALGYQLEAALPFAATEYEHDFLGTVPEFRELLAAAEPHVLALDGARGETEDRSYEAIGRLVARNCDLLIAVWDGGKGRGRGGTAEIVHYAARYGLPIWWIPVNGTDPAGWLVGPAAARHPESCPRGTEALSQLEKYLRQCVLPGAIDREPRFGLIGGLLNRLHPHPPRSPLHELFAETPHPLSVLWSLHRHVMRWAGGTAPHPPAAARPPLALEDAWAYWQHFYEPVDQCAMAYAERYRSSYVWVFLLAALAACAAILGVGIHPQARIFTSLELMLLAGILAVVAVNEFRHWHPRSITYRLLAELFRKQQALALLAWSLPAADAASVTGEADTAPVRDILVGWYFNATQRAAPMPRGVLGGDALARLSDYFQVALIEGQMAYHTFRQDEMERAAYRFGWLGAVFFLLTLATVFLKFLLIWAVVLIPEAHDRGGLDRDSIFAGFVAALLPALSAAFVGIRGYAELELLADQSLQMRRALTHCSLRLRQLRLDAPLASQELAAEILALTESMLRDVRGWAQLFRAKAVDVG
jgi:hypothetical protein